MPYQDIAQKENIEADTANKEADTANKSGQGENIKADTENKKLQADLQRINNKIAGDTAENAINTARIEMLNKDAEYQEQLRQNSISQETYKEQIGQVRANLALTLAEKNLKAANLRLTDEQVKEVSKKIELMAKDLSWKDIQEEDKHAKIMEEIKSITNSMNMNDTPESVKTITDVAEKIIQAVTLKGIIGGTPQRNPIGFK